MRKLNETIKSGKTTESLLTKLLQDKLRPRLRETIDKIYQDDHSAFPFATLVDLTNGCNLNCSWCIDKYARYGKEIPTKKMLDLLEEFKGMGILSVVYFGGGEPLMHSGIEKILRKTKELGIDYAINTNGILLDKVISIIGKTCSWTRVSWDAGDPLTYNKIHEGRDFFNHIRNNTEKLIKVANGTVGISFVVMKDNIPDICKATNLAKEIRCDFIQFKPEYTPLESNKRVLQYYDDALLPAIKNQLDKARKEETSNFSVLITGSLEAVLNKKLLNQNKKYRYCAAQQFIPLITPHGVYICPNWRGAKNMRVGNILKNSLKEIWTSDKRRKVIKQLNCAEDCQLYCLRHNINVLVNVLIEAKNMDLEILNDLKEFPGNKISDRYFI